MGVGAQFLDRDRLHMRGILSLMASMSRKVVLTSYFSWTSIYMREESVLCGVAQILDNQNTFLSPEPVLNGTLGDPLVVPYSLLANRILICRVEGVELEPDREHRMVVWHGLNRLVDLDWFGSEFFGEIICSQGCL